MKILYIAGVGKYGGACRSLCENLTFLVNKKIEIMFLVQRGDASGFYRLFSKKIISSIGLVRFDNTDYSFYSGIRWVVLLREIFYIPFTILALIRAKLKWKQIDIIHVNELTEIFTLVLTKFFFRKSKVIIHCRSVFRSKIESKRFRLIKFLVNKYADYLIAIDENVKKSLPDHKDILVINNSYSKNTMIEESNQVLKIETSNILKIGYVGTISEMKGIFDLIESLNYLKKQGYLFKLYIAGEEIRKYNSPIRNLLLYFKITRGSKKQLLEIIKNYNLIDEVIFLGHIKNMSDFYSKIDVVCFPSRLNTTGRPIIEAAYYSKPSVACVKKPMEDTLINYKTGIAVPSKAIDKLSEAIEYFINNKEQITHMGKNAKNLSNSNFNPKKNSNKLFKLYKELINE